MKFLSLLFGAVQLPALAACHGRYADLFRPA